MGSGVARRINNVNLRVAIYFLAIPLLVLYTLSLTGCISTSAGIPDLFLASIQGSNALQNAQVRIGYYAICGANSNNPKGLTCMSTIGASAESLAGNIFVQSGNQTGDSSPNTRRATANSTGTYSDLVRIGLDLQRDILIGPLVAAGCIFFLALLGFSLIKHDQRQLQDPEKGRSANKRLSKLVPITIGLSWSSTALAFSASLSTTETVSALQYAVNLGDGNISISAGTTLQVMQWFLFALSLLFSLGIQEILQRTSLSSSSAPVNQNPQFGNPGPRPPPPQSLPPMAPAISVLPPR